MVLAALFSALMALCAWISIPIPPVAVTMQTFGVLMALGTLGGKWGSRSVFLYLAMGVVGLPVFALFRGGIGALLDPTGGFLWGFALGSLVYWWSEPWGKLPAMVLCQLTCYFCGCLWFSLWAGNAGFSAGLLTCVLPFLLPDAFKLWLAYVLSNRMDPFLYQ